MRKFILSSAACILSLSLIGQVKGDGNITTTRIDVPSITDIDISLYAKIEVDMSQEAAMTITADANLLDLIDYEVIDGRLQLDQKKWIKPSRDIIIKIGAPDLTRIQQGTHETAYVRHINTEDFAASALVGEIVLEGSTTRLSASGEVGDIIATDLDVREVQVTLSSWGKIKLDSPRQLTGSVKGGGRVIYESEETIVDVHTSDDGSVINRSKAVATVYPDAKFIRFKLKNNSSKRINAYVRGPKPDGSYFSYGFPMRPGQVRKKDWSVGSKVYKVSSLGFKKLMVEIGADDEGEVVMMHPKS